MKKTYVFELDDCFDSSTLLSVDFFSRSSISCFCFMSSFFLDSSSAFFLEFQKVHNIS